MIRELEGRIELLLREKGAVVIAIDGNSASGKTTLAARLREKYRARVFHADDYFLRPEQRTPERLSEVGGNFDRERFLREAAEPAREHRKGLCRTYSCKTGILSPAVEVPFAPVTVAEGSYCLHPDLGKYYDISVFLSIDPREQSRRILERNGPAMHERFMEEWVPKENAYFSEFGVREKCDFDISCAYLNERK